jgi:quinohemoprotein amine dehydrogenase
MIRTGSVNLTPEQAREAVRYLSDHHGLAPEEERPVFYRAEKRRQLETFEGEDELVEQTCVRCHPGASFMTQRRTKEEWALLKGMHLGYFPVIEYQTFRGPSESAGDSSEESGTDGEEDPSRWRVDIVLDKLALKYPLETPEWKSFRAKGAGPGPEGRWLLSTHLTGKGPASGVIDITGQNGDYTYRGEIRLANGTTHERTGKGVLYGGYSWRGSSNGSGLGERRDVLMFSEGGRSMTGRFFNGVFGELGIDVTLTRLGNDPEVSAVWPRSAKVGAGAARLVVMGANLQNLEADDLDFGQGVLVSRVSKRSETSLDVEIEVRPDAIPGHRDVSAGTARAVDSFAVYDRVDYVRVVPEEALARVGGVKVPKELALFEAVAYQRGPDDEPLTDDDVRLGVVDAEWSLEEFHIRHEDDDVRYVGEIDENGLFTPAREGPNMERSLNADNFGEVWVVASYRPEGSEEPLRGRSQLIVTIPVYTYWDLTP